MRDTINTLNYQSLTILNQIAKKDPKRALKKVTTEFESLVWYEILKGLDRTIMKSDLFPQSFESKLYQEFLYQEVAKVVSGKPRGFGDYLYQQLLRSPYFNKKLEKTE